MGDRANAADKRPSRRPKDSRRSHTSIDRAAIEASLRAVQADFERLNSLLRIRKQPLSDVVIENMLEGYEYVDYLVAQNIDVFCAKGIGHLLSMNMIVHFGTDVVSIRDKCAGYSRAAADRFLGSHDGHTEITVKGTNESVQKWYRRHERDGVWKRSAGVYVAILSHPQAFPEGNHRTGSLAASYLLLRDAKAPFVLNPDNFVEYFVPSHVIKFKDKRSLAYDHLDWGELAGLKKKFGAFLKDHQNPAYLQSSARRR